MSGATTPVNILLHGLFFMRLNSSNNLEVLAPVIKDHHFVGGPKGHRVELTDKLIDCTYLTGKQDNPDPDKDIPGSVFQFKRADTDITRFTDDFSKFKGMILLKWPQAFYSLRTDDIAKSFPYVRTSKVGASIVSNATNKGSSQLGAVTLLQYTLPGAGALQNIHYYNQPCKAEDVNAVNADLQEAANCFQPDNNAFDLQLRTDVKIIPVDPHGEEHALYEDTSADVALICPLSLRVKLQTSGDPGTSPANCPTIFVG
jgi:hypothetical protein